MNHRSARAVPMRHEARGVGGREHGRARAVLFVACGGSSRTGSPTTTAPKPAPAVTSTVPAAPDVEPVATDFVNVSKMARVGDHFFASLNGHLSAALAVARSPEGGVYPVGTVIPLFPQEAMVKRHKGYSPATGDWEFFSLSVSSTGTRIKTSGARVKNFLGLDCASCHSAAKSHFDFVCGKNHGCAPLGVSDAFIANAQRADPRPT